MEIRARALQRRQVLRRQELAHFPQCILAERSEQRALRLVSFAKSVVFGFTSRARRAHQGRFDRSLPPRRGRRVVAAVRGSNRRDDV